MGGTEEHPRKIGFQARAEMKEAIQQGLPYCFLLTPEQAAWVILIDAGTLEQQFSMGILSDGEKVELIIGSREVARQALRSWRDADENREVSAGFYLAAYRILYRATQAARSEQAVDILSLEDKLILDVLGEGYKDLPNVLEGMCSPSAAFDLQTDLPVVQAVLVDIFSNFLLDGQRDVLGGNIPENLF